MILSGAPRGMFSHKIAFLSFFALAIFASPNTLFADDVHSSIDANALREVKRIPEDKYLTSEEAYALLQQDPSIFFVDVRDPVEIQIYGHPEPIDAVVPVRVQSTTFDERLLEWVLKDNPFFLQDMEEALQAFDKSKTDMIIVTCGSGWRSAVAAKRLHEAGYTNVWHIPDGYQGEEKPGINIQNAWQLRGLPWSFERVHGSRRLRITK